MDCLIIDVKINDDTGILHLKQYDCRKFMEIFKKMYDVNLDRQTRKIIEWDNVELSHIQNI